MVGLERLNAKETKVITYNMPPGPSTSNGCREHWVWNSNLHRNIKLSYSVLLYGSESWTVKPTLQKSLGCYTGMLHAVLNIDQNEHVTNKQLYGGATRAE